MAFLDRFRQPPWKHPDRQTRVDAVQELADDQQPLLASIARDDVDPLVRKTAVRKLSDLAALGAISRVDPDEGIREEAQSIVLRTALEGLELTAASAALRTLVDPRHIILVAKSAALEPVSRAALARLTELEDRKGLISVASHASNATIRLEALHQLTEPADIALISLKSDHKDIALAAIDQLSDPDLLQDVADHARNKPASRKARAKLKQAEPSAEVVSDGADASEQLQICLLLESLLQSGRWHRAAETLSYAEQQWTGCRSAAPDEIQSRYETAINAVREQLVLYEVARREEEQHAQARSQELVERTQVCELVESAAHALQELLASAQVNGGVISTDSINQIDEAERRVSEARATWDRFPTNSLSDARSAVHDRFQDAVRQWHERRGQWTNLVERRRRLESIIDRADQALRSEDSADAERLWNEAAHDWKTVPGGRPPSDLTARFREMEYAFSGRRAAAKQRAAEELEKNLARLMERCTRFEALVDAPDLALAPAERALRDIRAALHDPGALPSKRDHHLLMNRLKVLQSKLYPRVRELREIENWHRWANIGVQEALCLRMEDLIPATDPAQAERQMRDIVVQWKEVAAVPRSEAEPLWQRFKAARDQVKAICDEYFARQAAERAANLTKKEAICARAEALVASGSWRRATDEIQRLQADWRAVGAVPRLQDKTVLDRFHRACNQFFKARREFHERRQEEWKQNTERREALCARAEALTDSIDWDAVRAEIGKLQAEWNTVGPVKNEVAGVLQQRFQSASDRLMERYQQKDKLELQARVDQRDVICRELEALLPQPSSPAEGLPTDLSTRVNACRTEWQQAQPLSLLPRQQAEALQRRYTEACERLVEAYPQSFQGTDLDPEANRRKMEQLCARVEALLTPKTSVEPGASPAAMLARQLKEALAANSLGGRTDDEARWKGWIEQVRSAQAAWKRLGPVPGEAGRLLARRFESACSRFFQQLAERRREAPARSARPIQRR